VVELAQQVGGPEFNLQYRKDKERKRETETQRGTER
jgi:hypothetical protein